MERWPNLLLPVISHFRNYMSAGLLGALLGLISFPLLTRSLSVEEYGLLGLVSATVTIFVSFAKLGLQSAILRFFSEAQTRGKASLQQLISNLSGAVFLLGLLGTSLWLLCAFWLVPLIDDTPLLQRLFLMATALIPIKITQRLLANMLQADQQSGKLSIITVSEKLFRLLCLLAVVFAFGLSSERVLIIIIASELIFLVIIIYFCRSYLWQARPTLELAVLTPLIVYGVPAMMGELSAVLLETGDRYVIQAYMGSGSLGQYAAAVNICMYLEWVLILALQSAIVPHYIKLFEEKGRAETLSFLNGALEIYVAVAIGVFAVFCVAAPALVLLLAGGKYQQGLIVIPWFAAGYVLVGAISIAAAGVFIDKRTIILVKWTSVAFAINMILNLVAIPHYGLIAAAIATFIAMCIRSIGVYRDAAKTLPVQIPWRVAAQSLSCAVPAFFLGYLVKTSFMILDLFASSAITALAYVFLMLTINLNLREWVFKRLAMYTAK